MADQSDTNKISAGQGDKRPGPYLARVVSHLDSSFMGNLQVEILRPSGNTDSESEVTQVRYMSPFYGVTSEKFVGQDPNDYNNTQKSYGMWMIPPDVGTTVVVIFIDGDPKRGFWIGCVQDEAMNFMLPGYAATQKLVSDEYAPDGSYARVPVAEYNKKADQNQGAVTGDLTAGYKPKHPFADALDAQGLLYDSTRGITTSSARREVPSMVFGISTPGPLDKQPGSKRGPVGKSETKVPNAPVSRLGGSSFVMDDGDERWLRKKPASEAPPEYANVEQGETDGDPTLPHNELIRLRTRTGHQILLHNSEDLIYIGNARGTTWIELTSNGKIDIYAQDSVSVHTENDFNVTSDRDINLTAKGNINLNAGINFNATATSDWNIKADGTGKLSAASGLHINTGGDSLWTGGGQVSIGGGTVVVSGSSIDLNGPAAPAATDAEVAPKATRIPMHEPWSGHENLDPSSVTPDKTVSSTEEATASEPEYFQKYTTSSDTFNRQPPPATEEQA